MRFSFGVERVFAGKLTYTVLCYFHAQALAEFSSPEACAYHHRVGFVPHDTKQDLLIAEMSWEDAKVIC